MDNLKIPYVRNGDYYIPDLTLKQQASLGKYGRMRKQFLKEHRPILFNKLLLFSFLYVVNDFYLAMMETSKFFD